MLKIIKRLDLDKICRYAYELAILISLTVFILAPFHIQACRNINITKTYNSRTVSFILNSPSNLSVGDRLPVYRFNDARGLEIGEVIVKEIRKNEVICSLNPEEFYAPIGRHGRVVELDWPRVKVDIGSRLGLKKDDQLLLFHQRKCVGEIRLSEVSDFSSWAQVIGSTTRDLKGLTVSEFTIATQVAFFKDKFISFFEIILFLFVPATYFYFLLVRKKSIFYLFGNWLRTRLKYKKLIVFVFNVFACFPFVWFIVKFLAVSITHFIPKIIILINKLFNVGIPVVNLVPAFKANINIFYLLGLIIYFYVFFKEKKSPILLLWRRFSFRERKVRFIKGRFRAFIIWLSHLIIFYAFGSSLLIFSVANFNAIINIGWSNADIYLRGSFNFASPAEIMELIKSVFFALGYMFTHLPHFASFEAFFAFLRYILYLLTIAACFYGYGHSILSYFWGRRIRNLDFTIMGWFTNAIGYFPLLGVIIRQMFPSTVGTEPVITNGPLFFFVYIVEFFLNLLYMFTIWNLGKMFGVMTDKGVRTTKFYSVVRHPSYTVEALMFVALFMKGMAGFQEWIAVSMFIFIYYLRSEREDNFMSASNPEYASYKEKTHFKFLPGIY